MTTEPVAGLARERISSLLAHWVPPTASRDPITARSDVPLRDAPEHAHRAPPLAEGEERPDDGSALASCYVSDSVAILRRRPAILHACSSPQGIRLNASGDGRGQRRGGAARWGVGFARPHPATRARIVGRRAGRLAFAKRPDSSGLGWRLAEFSPRPSSPPLRPPCRPP